jgi:hypothetical protein
VQPAVETQQERIRCLGLPLAVYREVAAHLRQVLGLEVCSMPQTSQQFDYNQSQIDSLLISYPLEKRDRVEAILAYYAQRHGPWQRETV